MRTLKIPTIASAIKIPIQGVEGELITFNAIKVRLNEA
jgi:hypothetical protein